MFGWFKKEDWRLVKTIEVAIHRNLSEEEGKLYYHLFESNLGNRKVEYQCTLSFNDSSILEENAKRIDIYQEKIYRWEHGRYDPEIPRYNEIPEEETANALKGKV